MGGLPQYGDLSDNKGIWERVTRAHSKEQIETYEKAYAPLEPKNFVGLAPPSTVMFQFAEQDRFITQGWLRSTGRRRASPSCRNGITLVTSSTIPWHRLTVTSFWKRN